MRLKILCVVVLLGASCLAPVGCSSKKVSTTTSVVHESPDDRGERRVTTTETVEESDDVDVGCGGILSCTVGVIGEIIALPFRLVGGIIDVIF